MFIVYQLNPVGEWDYYDTLKADQIGILNELIDLAKDEDGFCNEYELFYSLATKRVFSGVYVKIFWEEETYGIWN